MNKLLFDALYEKDYAEIENILQNGADPNAISPEGLTPLMIEMVEKSRIEIFQLLIAYSADPFLVVNGSTCLKYVSKMSFESLKYFIDMGFTDDQIIINLFHSRDEYIKIKYVLDTGYVNTYPSSTSKALRKAFFWGKLDIATLLLDYNTDPNLQDSTGYTALHYCAEKFYLTDFFYKLITKYNADYNIPNKEGVTPRQMFIDNFEQIGQDINNVMYILR